MTSFQSSPETAADIEALAAVLRAAPIGSTVPYTSLTEAIGRDIRRHRHLLDRARKRVEAESGLLFGTVRDAGVKRLPANDAPAVGQEYLSRTRRVARRGAARLGLVKVNSLSEGDAAKVVAYRSMLGAVALVADGRKVAPVASEVAVTGRDMPAAHVLRMIAD